MLNDFIEQICDTFRDAICVSDREGKVLLVNRRHAELTGIPREEMLRNRIQDLVEKEILREDIPGAKRPSYSII